MNCHSPLPLPGCAAARRPCLCRRSARQLSCVRPCPRPCDITRCRRRFVTERGRGAGRARQSGPDRNTVLLCRSVHYTGDENRTYAVRTGEARKIRYSRWRTISQQRATCSWNLSSRTMAHGLSGKSVFSSSWRVAASPMKARRRQHFSRYVAKRHIRLCEV